MVHAVFEDETVDCIGRHAGGHHVDKFVEASRGDGAGLAHAFKAFLAIETDLAGVA